MSFSEAVTTCLRKYATFSGRASGVEYWKFAAFTFLLAVVPLLAGSTLHHTWLVLLGAVLIVPLIVPNWAAGVRRLHDTGRSGWWMIITLLPTVGAIIAMVLLSKDSSPAGDRFGPTPKGAQFDID